MPVPPVRGHRLTETLSLHASGSDIAASVTSREYSRLLQLPRGRELEGELLDRAQGARNWYARNGNPFVASRRVELREVTANSICTAGVPPAPATELNSPVLAQRLRAGEAHALMIIAATAGIEVAEQVKHHWSEGRPDEAFFLDRFAVAVTERLLFWAAATLCRASEPSHETLMPHLSPGCGNWDIADQHKLMALLTEGVGTHGMRPFATSASRTSWARTVATTDRVTLGPIQLLPSGALHPQHSVIAAMGVTSRNYANTPEHLCRSCDLDPCAFRRAPYSGDALLPMETR